MRSASIVPLHESDIDAARALLDDVVPVPAHLATLRSALESAALSPGSEQRGLTADVGGELAALAVYGEYAGATGAGRLHLVAVGDRHRRHGLGTLLIERIAAELDSRATRFILTELPDELPALASYFAFLRTTGFTEESRIPDFYREGVGVVVMRRERKQKADSRAQ
jgi:ribosomal protein S18 acetylase RimI-like enzyme